MKSVQKPDEQTMDSSHPRDQVVGKRAGPDEKRAADSSMVRCPSAYPDMSIVSLDDRNEEITEQWQDCLHDWYACRDDQCSAKNDRVSSGVSQRRCRSNLCACLKRHSISTPRECDAHSASRGPAVVPPQQPSAVAWFQYCFRVSHLFGVPSPRKMDSTDGTYFPGISKAPTNVANVVGTIATTAKMMFVHVLMVGIVSFVDHAVHAFPVVDALSTNSPCVDMFQLDRLQSQNRVEQRVRKTCLMNRMDLVQLGGYETNPEDPYTIAKKKKTCM